MTKLSPVIIAVSPPNVAIICLKFSFSLSKPEIEVTQIEIIKDAI